VSVPRLSETTLASLRDRVALPAYQRRNTRIGIVHIGPGAFHRAHQASYVDELLHADPRWAICAIALRSTLARDALMPQDGLYTLAELSETKRLRIIGSVREVLSAAASLSTALERLTARSTEVVTLTVTEKGYCLDGTGALDLAHPDIAHDVVQPHSPRSALGLLAEALRRRREQGVEPFTIVSCDNLSDNGPTLRNALIQYAAAVDPELSRWIADEVICPRTMVDSITPVTDDALRAYVTATIGLQDAWPVQREPFMQWVVQDVPVMHKADWSGVGVTVTTSVSGYERAKLRLLNGAHSTLAYAGLLCNHTTVLDAMRDTQLARFVERLMREDIAASLAPAAGLDLAAYIDSVLARFRNPGMRHQLAQIAWDGSKKLPVRLCGTIEDALREGRCIDRLCIPLAAWMRFIARQAKAGVPIVDPYAEELTRIGVACTGDARHDVALFAALPASARIGLLSNTAAASAIENAYRALAQPHALLQIARQA
jgi:fructuronate reductase